jgi:serine protein kinase
MINSSGLSDAVCAPQTVEMMAQFSVLTRLRAHENSTLYSKMRVYNGENIREQDPKAKSIQEYRDVAGVDEGMDGISTRFAYKIMSQTFNFTPEEIAADPVHLMFVLESAIKREQFGEEREQAYLNFIKSELSSRYAEFLGNEIQKSYLESYSEYGQAIFDRYVNYADAWIQDQEFKDHDTGLLMDRKVLNEELEKIEKPAGIANPKDFRNEIVNFCLRARAKPENNGKNPAWTSYAILRDVVEKKMFSQVEDLLPVISFEGKKDKELEKKHNDFMTRMSDRGYTPRQIRRLVEWYTRVRKSN